MSQREWLPFLPSSWISSIHESNNAVSNTENQYLETKITSPG